MCFLALVEFSGEEGYGRYLDLHECFVKFTNLKGIEVDSRLIESVHYDYSHVLTIFRSWLLKYWSRIYLKINIVKLQSLFQQFQNKCRKTSSIVFMKVIDFECFLVHLNYIRIKVFWMRLLNSLLEAVIVIVLFCSVWITLLIYPYSINYLIYQRTEKMLHIEGKWIK